MLFLSHCDSPFGRITLAADDESLKGLWFDGQKYYLSPYNSCNFIEQDNDVITNSKLWLDDYFAEKKPSTAKLSLAPDGSEFRKRVWDILLQIPYGETLSYGRISKMLGNEKMSAQAVGGAVGHNPISIIIPCHRVVGSNGSLTGYAGGLSIKQQLLDFEGCDISRFMLR